MKVWYGNFADSSGILIDFSEQLDSEYQDRSSTIILLQIGVNLTKIGPVDHDVIWLQ